MEEASLELTDIHYQSSQPWPFPGSLMLGFSARATSWELHLADEELAEARWCSPADIISALRHDEFQLPTKISIAYRLVEEWFDESGHGPLEDIVAGME